MRILDRSIYVGPSHFARFPVIRLELDLGELEAWPTGKLGKKFVDGLIAALPGLAEHGCSYQEPGGFIRRMNEDEGTWLGHVLEHVALELQNVAGEDVTFGKTRSLDKPGQYSVVYEYAEREEGVAAGELALRLLCSLLPEKLRPAGSVPEGWDWPGARDEYIRFAQRRALGPSTASLVHAAEKRGIPWLRLNDQSLIQLGHGKYQQRIQATVTGRTPHISVELASDKEETNRILAALGLPVPRQELVQSEREAVRAANRLGYPVVTKPYNGNHGRGISIRLTSDEEVAKGFVTAREHSRSVIVETYLEGDDHRLLVVDGELIAATRRTPGHVVGDGKHTVSQLVEIVNQDPRRGVGHEKVLTRLEIDHQAQMMLARAGLTAESVPEPGRKVYLRSTANLSTGGTATDVTDVIHPDNRDMAVRAVKAIGLDVGGVDFLSKDITLSYREIGGGICEINAAPGFRMHVAPSRGHGAGRRRPRHRHAVPARHALARADRGDHRHQRQDDDCAHARAHTEDVRLHAGPHDDGRRVHRRAANGLRRHDGSRLRAHGALRSAHRRGRARDRARRAPARRHGRRRGGRRRRAERAGRSPRAQGHRHARAARRGEARRRRGREALRRAER